MILLQVADRVADSTMRRLDTRRYVESVAAEFALTDLRWLSQRTIEIWGPEGAGKTTLAMIAAAQAQIDEPDKFVLFVDAEHRADVHWMMSHGIDMKRCVLVKPSDAEEVADMVKDACREGTCSMIIVDSIGAMIPAKEKEKAAEDAVVGMQAKIVTRMVKICAIEADRTDTTVILINQVCAAIGGEAIHGETNLSLADGSFASAQRVVDERLEGPVWAWDPGAESFVPRRIVAWQVRGLVSAPESWVTMSTDSIDMRGGRYGFSVSPDRQLMTVDGWKRAGDCAPGDRIMTRFRSVINGTLHDFLWGTLIGDSHVTEKGALRMQDSNNAPYVEWKARMLAPLDFHKGQTARATYWESALSHELRLIRAGLGRRDPARMLAEHYSLLGMAVWYMDDGWIEWNGTDIARCAISFRRVKSSEHFQAILSELQRHGWRGSIVKSSFYFSRSSAREFFDAVSPMIHPSMYYKLPGALQGRFVDRPLEYEEVQSPAWVTITDAWSSARRHRFPCDRVKYDISVEGGLDFVIGGTTNGVVVNHSERVGAR